MELKQFVTANLNADLSKLALKKGLLQGYEDRFVLQQIQGKRKAKTKFPRFFQEDDLFYPGKVAVEQSSSEQAARWKAGLVDGKKLLDMTGGFGVDTFHFSNKVNQVTYIEQKESLATIAAHNFKELKASNIEVVKGDSVTFLKETNQQFDWIYLDPARRDQVGRRKIGLSEYFPNVLEIKVLLLDKTENILLKASPLLDISKAVEELKNVETVHVIALNNEVKELLFEIKPQSRPLVIQGVHLKKDGTEEIFRVESDERVKAEDKNALLTDQPKTYIYEPNASILKAGLFWEVASRYQAFKLHPNSHLYTSEQLVEDFPGRIFKLKGQFPFQKKKIVPHLSSKKANIATRNFPYSVEQIKKKLAIKDGGEDYLFGTSLLNGSLTILWCRKLE